MLELRFVAEVLPVAAAASRGRPAGGKVKGAGGLDALRARLDEPGQARPREAGFGRDDLDFADTVCGELGDLVAFVDEARRAMYQFDADIPILVGMDDSKKRLMDLSRLSSVVGSLKTVETRRIYVPHPRRPEASRIVQRLEAERLKTSPMLAEPTT